MIVTHSGTFQFSLSKKFICLSAYFLTLTVLNILEAIYGRTKQITGLAKYFIEASYIEAINRLQEPMPVSDRLKIFASLTITTITCLPLLFALFIHIGSLLVQLLLLLVPAAFTVLFFYVDMFNAWIYFIVQAHHYFQFYFKTDTEYFKLYLPLFTRLFKVLFSYAIPITIFVCTSLCVQLPFSLKLHQSHSTNSPFFLLYLCNIFAIYILEVLFVIMINSFLLELTFLKGQGIKNGAMHAALCRSLCSIGLLSSEDNTGFNPSFRTFSTYCGLIPFQIIFRETYNRLVHLRATNPDGSHSQKVIDKYGLIGEDLPDCKDKYSCFISCRDHICFLFSVFFVTIASLLFFIIDRSLLGETFILPDFFKLPFLALCIFFIFPSNIMLQVGIVLLYLLPNHKDDVVANVWFLKSVNPPALLLCFFILKFHLIIFECVTCLFYDKTISGVDIPFEVLFKEENILPFEDEGGDDDPNLDEELE